MLELQVLGASLGLLDVLALDVTTRNLLQSLDGFGGSAGDILSGTTDGDSKKTGIGVDEALGVDLSAWEVLAGLGKEGETRSPFDLRLATKQGTENGNLRLVGATSVGAGAGEGDDNRVLARVSDTLLTTVVLGLGGLESLRGLGAGEELANPLGQLAMLGPVGDNGEVGLGVGLRSELGDGLGLEILAVGGRGGGDKRGAKAAVESQAVDGVQGELPGVGEALLVDEVDERDDLLVENVRL